MGFLVCAGMQKMGCGGSREGFVYRNVGVKVENVHPADLLFRSAPALLQCTSSDLWEKLGLCPISELQLHLHLCSALDSQLEAVIALSFQL